MKYGIVRLALVPVRVEPSMRSEMLTQILAGQLVEILQIQENWVFVFLFEDKYEGWIDKRMLQLITEEECEKEKRSAHVIVSSLTAILRRENGREQLVSMGARMRKELSNYYLHNEKVEMLTGEVVLELERGSAGDLIKQAQSFIGCPYLWGGKSPLGIDCSGFAQLIFKTQGVLLLRDAHQQAHQGELVAFDSDSKIGDLAFFDNAEGAVIHVGVISGKNTIIHSSGEVREDRWDSQGILVAQTGEYSHHLRVIRRMF